MFLHFINHTKKINTTAGHSPVLTFMQSFFCKALTGDTYAKLSINRYRMLKYHESKCRGFTLIEVLVSLGLFTTVVTMGVGTLLVLIDANGKQQTVQSVVTNVSFALDSMSREIRTGYFYECKNDDDDLSVTNTYSGANSNCPAGSSNFTFVESGGSLTGALTSQRIAYRLNGTTIERRLGNPGADNAIWRSVTAPEVVVDTLTFVTTGAQLWSDNGNLETPSVTIFISGSAENAVGTDPSFSLQTTVVQQILDI